MDQAVEEAVDEQELDAFIADSLFKSLEIGFNRFCPFEAVGMVRAEIRHSNYLGYVLNPFRPHGFDTTLLRTFLECALGNAANDLDETVLKEAEIRREWRNIDLLILLPRAQRVLAVELKIDASQSADQLERYREIVQAMWPGWTHDFRFLTKHVEKPNDEAWKELKLHDVIAAFDIAAERSDNTDTHALVMLQSYVSMMRRHHLGDPQLEKLARELWSKHEGALNFLIERRPDPLQELFNQLRAEDGLFAEAISTDAMRVVVDRHSKRILRFAFEAWDGLTSFRTARDWTATKRLILLEIQLLEDRLSAFLMVGPGTTPDRDTYVSACAPTKRNRYISLREDNLAILSPESDLSYEDVTETMARFVNAAFNDFDPIMQRVSAELQAQR